MRIGRDLSDHSIEIDRPLPCPSARLLHLVLRCRLAQRALACSRKDGSLRGVEARPRAGHLQIAASTTKTSRPRRTVRPWPDLWSCPAGVASRQHRRVLPAQRECGQQVPRSVDDAARLPRSRDQVLRVMSCLRDRGRVCRAYSVETGKVGNIERQNLGHTMDKRYGRQSCIVNVLAQKASCFDEPSPTLQQLRALGKNGEPTT
jgi:hypothetical protein